MTIQTDSLDKVLVVGLGFVGQTLALKLASVGYEVYGVDTSQETLDGLKEGRSHVREPGLNELISKHHGEKFHVSLPEGFSTEYVGTDVMVICVGTSYPPGAWEPDLGDLCSRCRGLCNNLDRDNWW
jgi:UDP-N-acetyl-D-mannosaminuronic acid dehydrogenase